MCPWRSWIARVTPTHKVAGSNPVGRTKIPLRLVSEGFWYHLLGRSDLQPALHDLTCGFLVLVESMGVDIQRGRLLLHRPILVIVLGVTEGGFLLPQLSSPYTIEKIPRRRALGCGRVALLYFVTMTNSAEPPGPLMVRTVSSLTFVNVRMPFASFVTVQLAGFWTVNVKSDRRCLFQ